MSSECAYYVNNNWWYSHYYYLSLTVFPASAQDTLMLLSNLTV